MIKRISHEKHKGKYEVPALKAGLLFQKDMTSGRKRDFEEERIPANLDLNGFPGKKLVVCRSINRITVVFAQQGHEEISHGQTGGNGSKHKGILEDLTLGRGSYFIFFTGCL